MSRVVAVDFDGCLAENLFPSIGAEISETVEACRRELAQGTELILWTCRQGDDLQAALDWCRDRDITFAAVNENAPSRLALYGSDPRKVDADEYWDDKAVKMPSGDTGGTNNLNRRYNTMNLTTRQKYMDAMARRADLLAKADEAASAGNVAGLKDFTAQAAALNPDIEAYQALMDQESRFAAAAPAAPSREAEDLARERMEAFKAREPISFTVRDVMRDVFGIRNSDGDGTTLATGTLVKPTEVDPNIVDAVGPLSSILEQVTVEDLTGTNGIKEPILYSDMTAYAGSVATLAGTARTASDPTFGSVAINPYEVNVTSLVDRNISRLTPVAYEAKIRQIAMRAMRRKAIALIYNGDGQVTPELYGIKTAVNTAGAPMVKAVNVTAIEAGFLDTLVFAYGGDEELAGGARLYLTKADLQAIGALRNLEDKRVYEIVPDPANPNTGRITEGGLIVPYTIASDLDALSTADTNDLTMLYGNPRNYKLGLFGPYTIRIDESVKSIERMNAILGDMFIGGNVTVPDGFVIAKKAAAGGGTGGTGGTE